MHNEYGEYCCIKNKWKCTHITFVDQKKIGWAISRLKIRKSFMCVHRPRQLFLTEGCAPLCTAVLGEKSGRKSVPSPLENTWIFEVHSTEFGAIIFEQIIKQNYCKFLTFSYRGKKYGVVVIEFWHRSILHFCCDILMENCISPPLNVLLKHISHDFIFFSPFKV